MQQLPLLAPCLTPVRWGRVHRRQGDRLLQSENGTRPSAGEDGRDGDHA